MSLTSPVLLIIVGMLTVICAASAAVSIRRASPGRVLASLLLILLTALLAGGSIGLKANAKMGWVATTSDLSTLLSEEDPRKKPPQSGDAQSGGKAAEVKTEGIPDGAVVMPDSDPAGIAPEDRAKLPIPEWTDPAQTTGTAATFTEQGGPGEYVGRVAGAKSGMETQVTVWTPPGYSPTSSATYDVLTYIHGFPGSDQGVLEALQVQENASALIAAGQVNPFIMVIPDLSLGGLEPSCVDIAGEPQAETFLTRDLPVAIRQAFPNVGTERRSWVVSGASAGGYCAPVMQMRHSDLYWGAIGMAGYDPPLSGGLMEQPEMERQRYAVSAMLGEDARRPADFYLTGTVNDPDTVTWQAAVEGAKKDTDLIQFQMDTEGAHNYSTWQAQLPEALKWWKAQTGEREGSGTAIDEAAQSAGGGDSDAVDVGEKAEPSALQVFLSQDKGPWSIGGTGSLALVAGLFALFLMVGLVLGPHMVGNGAAAAVGFIGRLVTVILTVTFLLLVVVLIVNNQSAFFGSWWDLWENRWMLG